MPKLTEYENPVSGRRGSITNLGDWKDLILGGIVLSVVIGLGAQVIGMIRRFVPVSPGWPAARNGQVAQRSAEQPAPAVRIYG